MPDYTAYNAGLQGFMTGRKLAREDTQYKQETEGRSGLGQLLKQDYEKENPEAAVPNFGNMDVNSQIAIVNYAKQKRKEIDEKEKLELNKGIEILKIGTEAASKSKGDVQKHLTKQSWGAALPILQKHGYFKDFDIAELDKKLNMADEKTISSFIKRTNAVSEALEAKTISTAEANKMTNQILAETIESIEDPNERKPVTDEITRIRKDLEPKKEEKPQMGEAALIQRALQGDEEAKAILAEMQRRGIALAGAKTNAALDAKLGTIDIPGTARAILEGRETIDNVRNTFGVPIQETIRKEVIKNDPNFNFNQPRATASSIKGSLNLQQKQRGMMGSFVSNLDKQVDRVDEIMKDTIKRVGVRGIDLPLRELNVRFKGSGQEKVLESYLIEISNEIGKLSTGSSASVRELSTEAQERWAKIHDPNLSLKELKKILDETKKMGKMRLDSTDREIDRTTRQLENVRETSPAPSQPTSKFKILKVE